MIVYIFQINFKMNPKLDLPWKSSFFKE